MAQPSLKVAHPVLQAIPGVNFFQLSRFLLIAFLVTFPLQIRTLVYNPPFLLTGNFNPYATFFVYLSDVALAAAFLCWGIALLRGETVYKKFGDAKVLIGLLLIFAVSLLPSVYFAEYRLMSFLLCARFFELMLLVVLMGQDILGMKDVLKYFVAGMAAQAGIAIFQYLFQHSLGLQILGEAALSPDTPGVAKMDVGGEKLIRAYGTFPHPNVLAGGLTAALFLSWHWLKNTFWLRVGVVALLSAALLLTFSRSAFLAFAGGVLVFISLGDSKIYWRNILLGASILL
ncbi:MAG TPA: hypothetical protein VI588_03605, partial [Candidatus Gracilibacteria bacterium]|nr:hypothetical protein [Candidatus Gracilibacteria bacterium]